MTTPIKEEQLGYSPAVQNIVAISSQAGPATVTTDLILHDRQQDYKTPPSSTYRGPVLATVPTLPQEDSAHLVRLIQKIAKDHGARAAVMTGADLAGKTGPDWDAETFAAGEDPRTPQQRDADEQAAEWRDTYQSILP